MYLGKDHWEAVRWILRYIKGTVDVGFIFEKDDYGKQDAHVIWTQIILGS